MRRCLWLVLLGCCLSHKVFAQTVPVGAKAGEVERSIEGKVVITTRAEKEAPVIESETLLQPELEIPETQKIAIKGFLFGGNTIASNNYLNGLTRAYVNRELTLKQLKNICAIITDAYRRRGFFLANAYLPPQEIKEGLVSIEVVEGRLGLVKIQGAKYYNKEFIRRHFRPEYKGVVNYHALLKSLLLLNEYSDLKVAASMQQGTMPYTVDVVLNVQDKRPLHAGIDYNNFGSRYVSKYRSGATVEYTNLIVPGDKVSLRGVTGSPTNTLSFFEQNYTLPLNSDGTKAKINYTRSDFNVQREFRRLDAGGRSRIYGVSLGHPFVRNMVSNIDFSLGFDYKDIKNYLLGDISSNDQLRVLSAGISGDNIIANYSGRNYFTLMFSQGLKNIMGGLKQNDPKASRVGAGGDFFKTNLDLARYQKFIGDSFLLFKTSSQYTSDVLTAPEQFSIGGADSVRGYPQSEYLGDYGFTGTFEVRAPLPFISDWHEPFGRRSLKQLAQLIGFYDYGAVYRKKALVGEHKSDDLKGAGVGLRLTPSQDTDMRFDLGWPLGRKPSDGDKTHLYMQGKMKF